MSCQFKISGMFTIGSGAPNKSVEQAWQDAQSPWMLDKSELQIVPSSPRVVRFCFATRASTVFAEEIVKTVQAWAARFADWAQGVMRYTVELDGFVRYCFFGPENRCIEAKLSSITQRGEDLQDEWTALNFTQLPQAGEDCVELVDYTGGSC